MLSGIRGAVRELVAPRYIRVPALKKISFSVSRGEIAGLLGPNGAGKSTMIKILTGILAPDEGRVTICETDPRRDRESMAYRIGAVFGQRTQLWWDLPAIESFKLMRDIFSIPALDFNRRLGEFSELLDLASFWSTPVRHLSLGQRVRCDLAASLLHDPEVLFLDEPTIGMDIVAKQHVREFLKHLTADRGKTIMLTTHDTSDVLKICDRVILINSGRLAFDGALKDLRSSLTATVNIVVEFTHPVRPSELDRFGSVHAEDPLTLSLTVTRARQREVLGALVCDFPVAEIQVEVGNLEQLLRDIYAGGDRNSAQ